MAGVESVCVSFYSRFVYIHVSICIVELPVSVASSVSVPEARPKAAAACGNTRNAEPAYEAYEAAYETSTSRACHASKSHVALRCAREGFGDGMVDVRVLARWLFSAAAALSSRGRLCASQCAAFRRFRRENPLGFALFSLP